MKITEVIRIGTMWAAMLGMTLPNTVFGAAPATTMQTVVRDVALGHNGVLNGRIVDGQGQSTSNAEVLIHRDGQLVARTLSDANGQFAAQHLSGGVYSVTAGNRQHTCRAWTAQTAPPMAASAVQLTSGEIVRGQFPSGFVGCADCGDTACSGGCGAAMPGGGGWFGGGGGLLRSPLLFAAAIGAAIAIPIALDDDDDNGASL